MPARRPWSRICLAAAAFALGCSHDATAPAPVSDEPLTIGLEVAVSPLTVVDSIGTPYIVCVPNLKTDRPATSLVTWTGSTIWFYAGPSRAQPVDSAMLGAATVQAQWHTRSNVADDVHLYSAWQVGAYIPFSARIEFRYHYSTGVPHASTIQFDCGPIVPSSPTPPAVSGVTVVVPSDPLSWADSVIINVTLASTAGLWQTVVRLSGPCELRQSFVESYIHATSHRVKFILPRDCGLGAPILASVLAIDALGQDSLVSVATTHVIADTIPPTMTAVISDRAHMCCPFFPFLLYFGGDSIAVTVVASDNRMLRHVVWDLQPAGVRDSIGIAPLWYVNSRVFKIPIPPTFTGNAQLRVFARDDAGLLSPVYTLPLDTIRVYPTVNRPVARLMLDGTIADMVLDAPHGQLYVLSPSLKKIDVVKLATRSVLFSIALPQVASSIDISANGDSLFVLNAASTNVTGVALPATIGVVNLGAPTPTVTTVPIDSVAFGTSEWPMRVRATVNGKVFVSTAGPAGSARVYEIDFRTHTQRKRYDAAPSPAGGATLLDYSGDRSTLIASVDGRGGFMRYDPLADTFSPAFPGVSRNGAMLLDLTGARVSIGSWVYDAGGSPVGQVVVADSSGSGAAAFSVDGQSFFSIYYAYGLLRTRIGTPGLAERTPLPTLALRTILTPDGATLIVAGYADFLTQKSPIFFVDMR